MKIKKYLILCLFISSVIFSGAKAQIISPSGGIDFKPYKIGANLDVSWEKAGGVDTVNIYIWKAESNRYFELVKNVPNSGAFSGIIPVFIAPGNDYKVVVMDAKNDKFICISKCFFSLSEDLANEKQIENDNYRPNSDEVKIGPNPFISNLNLTAVMNIENINVTNVMGAEVYNKTVNASSLELKLEDLESGSYFLKLTLSDGTKLVRKIIKQ